MIPATDYRIYQRDEQGKADVFMQGNLPLPMTANDEIMAHAVREEDNLPVTEWVRCDVKGNVWSVTLRIPQGGLYRLEAMMGDKASPIEWRRRIQNVIHVGVGELFMLTGQSNMAGYGRDMAFDPPELGVHLYGNNGKWSVAAHPLNDSCDSIYPENLEFASGVSPMLSFARTVRRNLHVPVGLVQASLGGSPLKDWDLQDDGRLGRAMLRRLEATGKVGCVVWYQGCTDADTIELASSYLERFSRMVSDWRSVMGDIPFITVQLNRRSFDPPCADTESIDRNWGIVREAQRQAARRIPDVFVVPTIDLPCSDIIHNSSGANVILGERMASVYLRNKWGLPGLDVPDVERVYKLDEKTLKVEMGQGSDIVVLNVYGEGIDAEDECGLNPCVKATGTDNGMLLTLHRPCVGSAKLHILWRTFPPAFVPRDRAGMPMLSCYGIPIED